MRSLSPSKTKPTLILSGYSFAASLMVRKNSDRFFGNGSGAPPPNKGSRSLLSSTIGASSNRPKPVAADGQGNFLSSQILIPILIQHLAQNKGFTGEIVKTVSGSDLIPRLAKLYDRSVYETPIGYKYIADRMLNAEVMIGGEESGGIGYGTHIPERDALLSALYVLEAVVQSGKDLSDIYAELQEKTGFTATYDRIDLPLASMEVRAKLLERLANETPQEVAGKSVKDCLSIDGYKFRLEDESWLLIRFSGTEPVLRLYCQADTMPEVHKTLEWAKDWANS